MKTILRKEVKGLSKNDTYGNYILDNDINGKDKFSLDQYMLVCSEMFSMGMQNLINLYLINKYGDGEYLNLDDISMKEAEKFRLSPEGFVRMLKSGESKHTFDTQVFDVCGENTLVLGSKKQYMKEWRNRI